MLSNVPELDESSKHERETLYTFTVITTVPNVGRHLGFSLGLEEIEGRKSLQTI